MLSVWWDFKGIVFFELLLDNTTINSEVYCDLDSLNDSFKQKKNWTNLNDSFKHKRPELINRKGIVFHHNNVRFHTSLVTCQKLLHLEWDALPHSPYSPEFAPFFGQ